MAIREINLILMLMLRVIFFTCAAASPVPNAASELKSENRDERSMAMAERTAIAGFKKYTHNKVRNFSWRLLYEDEHDWTFSFEDLDIVPHPGSDYFVTVNKLSGETTINRGI